MTLNVTGMPTVEEVCQTFGLTDIHIEYTDADFQNLTTYKLFQQHVRPLLAKDNPKVLYYGWDRYYLMSVLVETSNSKLSYDLILLYCFFDPSNIAVSLSIMLRTIQQHIYILIKHN